VRVDPINTTLKAPGTKRLKLEYDEALSNFAFNFNLRRYTVVKLVDERAAFDLAFFDINMPIMVGRCRLTVSKPVLKAPMVSALETIIWQTAFNCCFQSQLAPLHHGRYRSTATGRAVQFELIKPTLKAPGSIPD